MGRTSQNSDQDLQLKKEYHPPKLVDYGEISKITRYYSGPTNDGPAEGSQPKFLVPPHDAPGESK